MVAIVTDGRRTPVGGITALKIIERHEKLGVLQNLGDGATPAPNPRVAGR